MFALKSIAALLASMAVANASRSHLADVTARQASEIPPGALYLIEWYPNGCGNGDGVSLTGYEETLAVCSKFNGLYDPDNPPDSASVRFLFPEGDDRTFMWQLFGTNDCSEQIAIGKGAGCYNIPNGKGVGAVIVYT